MSEFNKAQRIVLQTYGGGDYAHLESIDQCEDVGDTLFTFLMRELADSEDCDTMAEAIRRVEQAREQLADLQGELEEADA